MTTTTPPPTIAAAPAGPLSEAEIARFRRDGWLGPYPAVSVEAMATIRAHIDEHVLTQDGPSPSRQQSRHMDSAVVYDLATSPAILDRMAQLYGPHLILWATNFFDKPPGGKEIPWHQDLAYWPLEPIINISAWIAIDKVTTENSCVRVIPGSHKTVVPVVKSTEDKAFAQEADPAYFDASQAIEVELEPGEFFLFNEKLLHHSYKNTSDKRRMGMSVRVTIPIVKIEQDISPLHPGHTASLVRGEDYMSLNRLASRPTTDH